MPSAQLIKSFLKYPIELYASIFGAHRKDYSEPRLWIMMYHRILPQNDYRFTTEEPGMVVEPKTFEMHIKTLQNEFTLIHLNDWIKRKKAGLPLPNKACAITFDDGWLDNYEFAFPILEKLQAPATLFAVSNMVGSNQTFWPNRIQNILSQPKDKMNGIDWFFEHFPDKTEAIGVDELAKLINTLKQRSDESLMRMIEEAEKTLSIKNPEKPVIVNESQLHQMAHSDLIEIGSHTQRHIRLVRGLPEKTYFDEIVGSKKQLEEIIEKPIHLFCYPNGDFCEDSVKLVSQHYQAAVTTRKGINNFDMNIYTLNRFGVHQDISNNTRKFLARISGV